METDNCSGRRRRNGLSLFGGLLAEGGLDVTLVDVWQDHVERINRDGLTHGRIRRRSASFLCGRPTTQAEWKPVDVVFVQCKAPYTREAVRRGAAYPAG